MQHVDYDVVPTSNLEHCRRLCKVLLTSPALTGTSGPVKLGQPKSGETKPATKKAPAAKKATATATKTATKKAPAKKATAAKTATKKAPAAKKATTTKSKSKANTSKVRKTSAPVRTSTRSVVTNSLTLFRRPPLKRSQQSFSARPNLAASPSPRHQSQKPRR